MKISKMPRLLASQSIPSWNQIIEWLKEMDAIRVQSFSQGSRPSESTYDLSRAGLEPVFLALIRDLSDESQSLLGQFSFSSRFRLLTSQLCCRLGPLSVPCVRSIAGPVAETGSGQHGPERRGSENTCSITASCCPNWLRLSLLYNRLVAGKFVG